jgi:hypothetical protein
MFSGNTSFASLNEAFDSSFFATESFADIQRDLHGRQNAIPTFAEMQHRSRTPAAVIDLTSDLDSAPIPLPRPDNDAADCMMALLDGMKKKVVRISEIGDDADICAVCADHFDIGQETRTLPCDHMFHTTCLTPWLAQNKDTCPMCRREMWREKPDEQKEVKPEETQDATEPMYAQDLNF